MVHCSVHRSMHCVVHCTARGRRRRRLLGVLSQLPLVLAPAPATATATAMTWSGAGVLSPLKEIIGQGSPLKQFALPIVCDIAKATSIILTALVLHTLCIFTC